MRVAVVGLGYVGLVTATCLARLGQEVVGLEVDPLKLAALGEGRVPYYEPNLAAELASQRAAGHLTFTDDPAAALRDADVILICVGTPSDPTGHADLRFVLEVAEAIGRHVQGGPVVALRSTVPVGTTERIERELNDALTARGIGAVAVFANPEFLRTGRALDDFLHPSRVVIGRTELGGSAELETLTTLYAPLNAPIVVMDASSAELVKNASNAFLALRISFANEIAKVCDATGARVDDVVLGMSFDPRIGGQFMQPGLGYGGSCLPKDVRSLIAVGTDFGLDMPISRAVDQANSAQVQRVVDVLERGIDRPLSESRVGVLGLAFKPDTDDTRDSPAIALVRRLRDLNVDVVATDPEAADKTAAANSWLKIADGAIEAARNADAIVLATEWPAFVTVDLGSLAAVMRGTVLVDARNALDPEKVAGAGLDYFGIGRPQARKIVESQRVAPPA
jgi:UDPglucose 6-dehydrogenase